MAFTNEQKREQRLERKRAREAADAAAGITRRPAHCPPAGHNWDERRGEYVVDEAELEAVRTARRAKIRDGQRARRIKAAAAFDAAGLTRRPLGRAPAGHRWDQRRGEWVLSDVSDRSDVPLLMPPNDDGTAPGATAAAATTAEAVDVAWALENPVPRLGRYQMDIDVHRWDLVREPWVLRLTGRPLPPYGAGGSNAARSAAWLRAVGLHRDAVRRHARKVVRVATVKNLRFNDNSAWVPSPPPPPATARALSLRHPASPRCPPHPAPPHFLRRASSTKALASEGQRQVRPRCRRPRRGSSRVRRPSRTATTQIAAQIAGIRPSGGEPIPTASRASRT